MLSFVRTCVNPGFIGTFPGRKFGDNLLVLIVKLVNLLVGADHAEFTAGDILDRLQIVAQSIDFLAQFRIGFFKG